MLYSQLPFGTHRLKTFTQKENMLISITLSLYLLWSEIVTPRSGLRINYWYAPFKSTLEK